MKTQTTAGSEIERDETPRREIATPEPRGQPARKQISMLPGAQDTKKGKAPVRPAEAVNEKRQTSTGETLSASNRATERVDVKGKPQSGSRVSVPTAVEAPFTPELEDGSRDQAPEATDTKSGVQSPRTADTDRLHEGLDWEYCGLRPVEFGPAVLPPQPSAEDPLLLSADTFDYDQVLDLLWLEGDVRAAQGNRRVAADKVVYDRNSADLVAKGNVFLANPGVRVVAQDAQINLESDRGTLSDVHYRLTGKINARGTAAQAELVRPTLTRYRDIVYTSCRPGQNAWALDAAELELNQATGRGTARDAKLRVRGVPVFYAPYLSFPIDERRKSGVLVPAFGNSDTNGIDVTVPYYWNIAPNMDATISARYMSKRGLMLGTEFRYLSPSQEAEIYGEIIPEDSLFEDDGTRWGVRIEQTGRFDQRWSSVVNFNAVSDDEYLEDFGNNLDVTSLRNIEQRGDLYYQGNGWYLLTRLQDFQTLDPALAAESPPYGRLPQLLFRMDPYSLDSGVELGVGGEYDYFVNDVKVQGQRVALQPYVRWPLRKSYGHLIPQLILYTAAYGLQDQEPGKEARPSYLIPSFNLDGSLIFERRVDWFGQESVQTLEPRVYYLYTPYKDQDDQPIFDSSALSFSYFSLFQPNRFTGWDRIGDANQVTLGLTSRTLAADSGRELLSASIGQILYFRDRDVQISGESNLESRSSIAGVLSARLLENWTGRASFAYDPTQDSDPWPKRALELHYRTADNRLLNLAYRFDLGTGEDDRYENTDLSFRLPVNPQLKLVGLWNYSLLYDQTVEVFAGIEYGQCCWRVRLVGRHLKNKPDSDGSNSFMIQVELAGLGSIGQQIDKLFERSIYGYHAN